MLKVRKIVALGVLLVSLAACGNKNALGWGNYTYNYLTCGDEYGDFKNEPIKSWKDFEGEQIEVSLRNGNNLLISLNNCFLSKEEVGY